MGLLPGMGPDVLGETILLRETLATHRAQERLLSGMRANMLCKAAPGLGSPAADGALERFLPSVGPQVPLHVAANRESLAAHRARNGLSPV